MARRRRNRRYRRGRFLPLLRILLFLLICGALAAAMTVFFKVEEVSVSGNSRYTAQEVVEASGVALGDNLYLLNKNEIVARLTRELPYISQVRIRRQLPSTLTVEVTETQAAAAVESGGTVWLISGQGKLLEQGGEAGGLPRITGLEPLLPTAGGVLALASESPLSVQRLLELLAVLEEKGMTRAVALVDCRDPDVLRLRYADRFQVELRYDADLSRKMNMLLEVVARLEANETGVIRMTREDGFCHFIPGELEPLP